jgi:hypothetical protein
LKLFQKVYELRAQNGEAPMAEEAPKTEGEEKK